MNIRVTWGGVVVHMWVGVCVRCTTTLTSEITNIKVRARSDVLRLGVYRFIRSAVLGFGKLYQITQAAYMLNCR